MNVSSFSSFRTSFTWVWITNLSAVKLNHVSWYVRQFNQNFSCGIAYYKQDEITNHKELVYAFRLAFTYKQALGSGTSRSVQFQVVKWILKLFSLMLERRTSLQYKCSLHESWTNSSLISFRNTWYIFMYLLWSAARWFAWLPKIPSSPPSWVSSFREHYSI